MKNEKKKSEKKGCCSRGDRCCGPDCCKDLAECLDKLAEWLKNCCGKKKA